MNKYMAINFVNFKSFEKYYEEMAKSGYLIKKIKKHFLHEFEETDKKNYRFSITIKEELRNSVEFDLNRIDSVKSEQNKNGWKLLLSTDFFDVFYTELDGKNYFENEFIEKKIILRQAKRRIKYSFINAFLVSIMSFFMFFYIKSWEAMMINSYYTIFAMFIFMVFMFLMQGFRYKSFLSINKDRLIGDNKFLFKNVDITIYEKINYSLFIFTFLTSFVLIALELKVFSRTNNILYYIFFTIYILAVYMIYKFNIRQELYDNSLLVKFVGLFTGLFYSGIFFILITFVLSSTYVGIIQYEDFLKESYKDSSVRIRKMQDTSSYMLPKAQSYIFAQNVKKHVRDQMSAETEGAISNPEIIYTTENYMLLRNVEARNKGYAIKFLNHYLKSQGFDYSKRKNVDIDVINAENVYTFENSRLYIVELENRYIILEGSDPTIELVAQTINLLIENKDAEKELNY